MAHFMKCKGLLGKLPLYGVDYIESSLDRELNTTAKIGNAQIRILEGKKAGPILLGQKSSTDKIPMLSIRAFVPSSCHCLLQAS